MNLWCELYSAFKVHKNNIALISSSGNQITYKSLAEEINIVSQNIRAKNLPNKRIAFLNNSSFSDAISCLSILAADCTAVPLSLKYGYKNCINILQNIKPSLIITDMAPLPAEIISILTSCNIKIATINELNSKRYEYKEVIYSNEIALILSTSGTTGMPKGVVLTHNNVLANLEGISGYFKLTDQDKLLISRPLYHGAVMTGEFLYGLMKGCSINFYERAFSPRLLIKYIKERQINVMCGTPTMLYNLSAFIQNNELNSLRIIVTSGECLNVKIAENLVKTFSEVDLLNVYGLTEASPRVSYLESKLYNSKIGSVGVPLDNIKVMVVDKNNNPLPQKAIGELLVKGPNVMSGYWNNPVKTKEKIQNNWLHTGDLAYLDEDGFIFIQGRIDDMIIRAGVNIYPQEIESVLLSDCNIKEAVAWGTPDIRYGQKINVAVTKADNAILTKEYIINLFRKNLQPYQWPENIYIVDALPKNASGKIVRKGLDCFFSNK